MELKKLLRGQIEREHTYLSEQQVGTEQYNASMGRLNVLEEKMVELVKTESEAARKDKQMEAEKRDRLIKNSLEVAKITTNIVMPIVGLVAITAFERGDTFTTSLRGFINCFIPKKL